MDKVLLRKVQLVQLEIAKEVKRVCEENDIQYFLDSGTLLGAIRHKGFIPWDDDLDLGMVRAEYDKFLKIAPQKLSPKYKLITWEKEQEYPHQFCKIMKIGTTYLEEAQKGNATSGIFVDIFPYDNFPDDVEAQEKQRRHLSLYRAMVRAKCHHKTWTVHGKFYVKRWIKNLPVLLLSCFYSKKQFIDR